jgi:hypothetical protein
MRDEKHGQRIRHGKTSQQQVVRQSHGLLPGMTALVRLSSHLAMLHPSSPSNHPNHTSPPVNLDFKPRILMDDEKDCLLTRHPKPVQDDDLLFGTLNVAATDVVVASELDTDRCGSRCSLCPHATT